MRSPFSMLSRILLLLSLVVFGGLTACKEPTAAQRAEEEIKKIREAKRLKTIEHYKKLAKDFPEHPKALEAANRAAQLEAETKKK